MSQAVKNFVAYFEKLSDNKDYDLGQLYDDNIVFQDPVKIIRGLPNLKAYFYELNSNVENGYLEILSTNITEQQAFVEWKMHITAKKPVKKNVTASGISVLHFNDKITSQRDYFDAGELFYEHIPLLGSIIRFLKRKL
jgi:limonene-1,2-epoxide hydrolase